MGEPRFASLAESKTWLADDVIAEAIEPVLAIIHPKAEPELREYLGELLTLHPIVRTLFQRAAKLHTIPNLARVDKAARLEGEEEEEEETEEDRENAKRVPTVPKAKKVDRYLVGLPTLDNPAFQKAAKSAIEGVAKKVSRQWRKKVDHEHISELVGVGWVVAVEATPDFDPKGSTAFSTYIWQVARNRMINFVKKSSNRYETPMSGMSCADISKDSLEADDAETELRRLANETAVSWALGSLQRLAESPEDKVTRVFEDERVRELVRGLDADEQRLMALVFGEDMSCREAAEHLGVSARTAAYWQTSAIAKLRKGLEETSNVTVLRKKRRSG